MILDKLSAKRLPQGKSEQDNGNRKVGNTLRSSPSARNGRQQGAFALLHDNRKQRGGYYTPAPVAAFLADWAIQDQNSHVLEPSAGDGQIVTAAAQRLGGKGHITAVELYSDEAQKAQVRGGARATVTTGDFFAWFRDDRRDASFDCVLGNPPFIRYQDFPEQHRGPAFELMREEGMHPSRLTNAWLPFVTVGTRALRPGGRLALVLPAELLQVGYAAELREYLTRKYSSVTIVTFRRLVFDGIQQEIILLLGVRQDSPAAEMRFVELDRPDDLRFDQVEVADPVKVNLNHAREKWTQYYLSPTELELIREMEGASVFTRLGTLAEVDVGIVTGRNEFFVLTKEEAERHEVLPWCIPLVGRSAQIPGLALRENDWGRLAADNGKCFLLHVGDVDRSELPKQALAYVEYGERSGFHNLYKCRIRLPRWWNVPSVWSPDAFLLRQIHNGPRIVQNAAGTTCTDTIHRVRTAPGIDSGWLAAASMNSMTFAFAEIRGRSYGGGVLELEPTEAESLPFPKPESQELPVDDLDIWARERSVEQVLKEVDRLVLKPAGLSKRDIETLRGIWRKLFERRKNRKRR